MSEIAKPLDSVLAKSVSLEMKSFNNLYKFESDRDTLSFNLQRNRFIAFINSYDSFLTQNKQVLFNSGITSGEIEAIIKSNAIFKNTYSKIQIGDIMSWPNSYNIRDKSMFEIIKWYKEQNPKSKIIIWAHNGHIENKPKPNNNVNWMGHMLKNTYGAKYYSIGEIVYSGKSLNYNGPFEFESSNNQYLAYYLNQFNKDKFVLDLRAYKRADFTSQLLLGTETNGPTEFIAKDRFDGLLFIKYSDIPKLLKKE